jgi:hypothetical protein
MMGAATNEKADAVDSDSSSSSAKVREEGGKVERKNEKEGHA